MSLIAITFILLIHWISDFIFQSRRMAKHKSKSVLILLEHVSVYSFITLVLWSLLFSIPIFTVNFLIVTYLVFFTHFIVDYITSKVAREFYEKEKEYAFFVTIGFDQFLHYVSLIYIFRYFVIG